MRYVRLAVALIVAVLGGRMFQAMEVMFLLHLFGASPSVFIERQPTLLQCGVCLAVCGETVPAETPEELGNTWMRRIGQGFCWS
jgi:hypothetical protein